MANNFNWQTEDEVTWDDLEPAAETAVSRRRPWLTYILILAGVLTVVGLIFRQVNQRVEVATANATGDILASHNLVQQASAGQDVELFNTLLSGRDTIWVDSQSELVQSGGLFDRSSFDLTQSLPDTAVTQADVENGNVGITLNPELNAAELTFPQSYEVAIGNRITETIRLQQTAVYRLGTQRWLYAPPEDEFWGEFETTSGTMLRLAYPARDAELASRLALDLETKLVEMCRLLADLNCPDGFHMLVRLDSDPRSLVNMVRPDYVLDSDLQLNLPAPTLVGLPLDEAGYQALYRGYAIQLVSAAVAGLTGFECCDNLAFFQALLDYQLDELGLRPLTLDRVEYDRVVRENISFEGLDGSWRSHDDIGEENGWLVMTAVDFLRRQLPDLSIVTLQRHINDSRRFFDWLSEITDELAAGPAETASSLSERWQSYAFEQYQARQAPPPLPLPAQDIYLLCMINQEEPSTELFRYQLASSEWQQQPLESLALSLNPLPDDNAFLLLDAGDDSLHTYLWQDGSSRVFWTGQTITFGQFDPTEKYLLAYYLDELVISRVDWPACSAGDCTFEPLGGYPVWSPEGTDFIMLPAETLGYEPFLTNGRTILFDPAMRPTDWPLYRGNGQPPTSKPEDLTRIGTGFSPFWLDESTFGFVWQIQLSSDSNRHELVLMSTADEVPHPILSETELQLALPNGAPPTTPTILYVMPHPHQREQLFIVATGADRALFVFSFNYQTDDLQFLLESGVGDIHSLGFSPDGRFLVVNGPQNGQQLFSTQRNDIILYDLTTNQMQTFAGVNPGFAPSNTYDWSADGQWLVIAQDNQTMTLAAPAYDYVQFIPHNLVDCGNVAWLNQ